MGIGRKKSLALPDDLQQGKICQYVVAGDLWLDLQYPVDDSDFHSAVRWWHERYDE